MAKQNQNQETSTPQPEKTTTSRYDYVKAMQSVEEKGKEIYGPHFIIHQEDKTLLRKLLCYFLKDDLAAVHLQVDLTKGILLTGPVGCGKTALMTVLRFFEQPPTRYILKSCRDVSFEFIQNGYETIHKYSRHSFRNHDPQAYCFDDLGTENNLKYFGNECNVMAEILLSRYDQFISRQLITHLTTNLSASEIEAAYGNRVRSRMREMFNLIAFSKQSIDKRK
jgi:predicted ATPase